MTCIHTCEITVSYLGLAGAIKIVASTLLYPMAIITNGHRFLPHNMQSFAINDLVVFGFFFKGIIKEINWDQKLISLEAVPRNIQARYTQRPLYVVEDILMCLKKQKYSLTNNFTLKCLFPLSIIYMYLAGDVVLWLCFEI